MLYLRKTLILLFVSVFALTSCKKDDDGPATSNLLEQGRWRVALFAQGGVDKAAFFNDYEFRFGDNGVVTASKSGASTVTGSWIVNDEDDDEIEVIFNFGSTTGFNGLNEDWKVVERTSSRVRFEHSRSNGTDLLTLERF
ncbi:hypothetical protein [Pedobacter sp. SYSU D00535]|uniref:hypothetical protein n=1 Tax=Pedobacter sp. SYSU D00535 TaxID=2810308 RepID=UPI001A97520E|nr:hypothetical protein [Pedobacter sp. SYSU D00535]